MSGAGGRKSKQPRLDRASTPGVNARGGVIHEGVQCDECGVFPIKGRCFTSKVSACTVQVDSILCCLSAFLPLIFFCGVYDPYAVLLAVDVGAKQCRPVTINCKAEHWLCSAQVLNNYDLCEECHSRDSGKARGPFMERVHRDAAAPSTSANSQVQCHFNLNFARTCE